MKRGQSTYSGTRPEEFEIRKLFAGKNIYELVANSDITEEMVVDRFEGKERKQYTYLRWCSKANIDGYDDAVAALVALRYTFADEFSLTRKGQAHPDDAEYTAYLAYVDACKAFAQKYFAKTDR